MDYDGRFVVGMACAQCGRVVGNVFTDYRLRCEVPPDPTAGWIRQTDRQPVFDFVANALNATALGAPVGGLAGLGPAEDKIHLEQGCLTFYSLGLSVWIDGDECVESIELFADDSSSPEYVPFAGTGTFRGRTFRLGEITESEFVTLFGDPYWRDDDGAEVLLFYEFGDLEWQAEFTKEGRFKFFLATNEPLLEDEEQRKSYFVTKPRPPGTIHEGPLKS
jgi:hypothetical protein